MPSFTTIHKICHDDAASPGTDMVDEPAERTIGRAPAPEMKALVQDSPSTKSEDSVHDLLDRQLIDPWQPSSNLLMDWFKRLVREDYFTAEALWVGLYCSLCVSVGMSLVHSYMLWHYPAVQSCAVVYCMASSW